MGHTISLDDFGTGYSSLTHVRRFPLSAIKVDKSFVATMCSDRRDLAVVQGVLGLAHALDLVVVAEGVEHDDQLRALIELGCDYVQGHLVGVPMEPDAVVSWFAARRGYVELGRRPASISAPPAM